MKGYLSQKKIPFETRDISSDEAAEKAILDMGFTAVPVTVVGDGPPILGSDFAALEKALAGGY